MKIKNLIKISLLSMLLLVGCGPVAQSTDISVVSREDGSGTRGAFVELVGILEKDADGKKVDKTVATADISSSTGVVITTVSGNESAIGYISLGSLNNKVKALEIDGVIPNIENIKNGQYKIARPFNIATNGEVNPQTQDLINFILSKEGQSVVEENGFISKSNTGSFKTNNASGKVSIIGSSSVAPVMEKLKEAYALVNDKVSVEISQSDSTNGMNSVSDKICDIGMASRELKESELAKGLKNEVIAIDGIAVIVNNNNVNKGLTLQQVKDIYVGKITSWEQFNK
ncbi:MAG: substrate-binding domain-containing protein [Erysipelotrichaceae bacterium]